MSTELIVTVTALAGCLAAWALPARADEVVESAREIPVAYAADVVVVGGSTGAVAAAVAAAKKGAKVFLAAPRTYLGEDMGATLRIWLSGDEALPAGLMENVQPAEPAGPVLPKGAAFTYQADRPSAGAHKDTRVPSVLTDGQYRSSARQSVEYDDTVTITADLGAVTTLRKVHVLAYQRPGDFEVAHVTVSGSADGKDWKPLGVIDNDRLGKGTFDAAAIDLSAETAGEARYVKLLVEKAPKGKRILLGEVVIETGDAPASAPADAPAGKPAPPPRLIVPMEWKRALDAALLAAGVKFLYGCYPTDVLRDADGRCAGIVMANRAGRQAVVAPVIVDATHRAVVARMAGAKSTPYPSGEQTFRRVVIGGEVRSGEGITARKLAVSLRAPGGRRRPAAPAEIIEYTLRRPMKDAGFASFATAEQVARDMTYDPGQLRAADELFQIPPDPIRSLVAVSGTWGGAASLDLGACRPAGVDRLYVLGGCADVPREAAEELMRPAELAALGRRVGEAAADEAKACGAPKGAHVPGGPGGQDAGTVRELLTGVRPIQDLPTVPQQRRALPVLGRYDVVVVGGGTSGAPAAIGAARKGVKVLVIEYQHGLGGVGTLGLIGGYYHGRRVGFTAQVDAALGTRWNVERKMEWWRREIRKAGGDIWFGAIGCGALVADGKVKGVVAATPLGRGAVLADVVIDSTGNSDIAAAAGAACLYTDGAFLAVQGTGLPPRNLGASYTNTDYTFSDETDMLDVWRVFVSGRRRFAGSFDMGTLIDTRERRRIVGDFVQSIGDILCGRTFPDTVCLSRTNFDTHGYTVDPLFLVAPPHKRSLEAHTPYRSLLPRGLEGILVTGLGTSAHRDAVPILRMQPDLQNQGHAAGTAAAMAAKIGGYTRKIDIRQLQAALVKIGSVPETVLADKDNFPLPAERIAEAVAQASKDCAAAAVVLSHSREALPLLRKACTGAAGAEKAAFAHILAVLGDATHLEVLIQAVDEQEQWDRGWNFRGMGQFGASLSRLDSRVIALGRTHDARALEAVVRKAKLLDPSQAFSHHRAVAEALEALGAAAGGAAAKVLADLLAQPGMTGHAVTSPDAAEDRSASLREIILARALYRLGDCNGVGKKILTAYTTDLRGHYARHVHAVLAAGSGKP